MKPIQVGDVVGDYTVIDVVGAGGMGAVYRIEHLITKRIEAMKLLPPGWSAEPDQVRRFEREIQLQAKLHHPNIVSVYNAVRDGESMALVMEFVEGETLKQMIESGPLPVETAMDFACQVLRALAYAHAAGVIHRDVSPANVIVTPERVAKLTDFGLARGAEDLRLSTSGAPVGSPWYMSPEQVKGVQEPDARTDLYAMGAVLHEMLTGRKLFEAEGAFAVMLAQVEAEPLPPSSLNPAVPAAFDAIVAKAVAKDPAMRYASADEFRRAVEQVGVYAGRSRFSRAAVLWGLAPAAVMAAGFTAVRLVPKPVVHPRETPPPAAAVVVTPEPAPAPAPASVSTPVAVEEPPPAVVQRPRVASSPRLPQKSPQPVTALRVTGAELPPSAVLPAPKPSPFPPALEASPPAPSPAEVQPVEAAPTPQEAAPADPEGSGNRFVRALGKVNPFRKRTKPKDQK